jgi:hypothetical protein
VNEELEKEALQTAFTSQILKRIATHSVVLRPSCMTLTNSTELRCAVSHHSTKTRWEKKKKQIIN